MATCTKVSDGDSPSKAKQIACPFADVDNRKCTGHIYRATAYCHPDGTVRKWHLHCSVRTDHPGRTLLKEPATLYPDQLPIGMDHELWEAGIAEIG